MFLKRYSILSEYIGLGREFFVGLSKTTNMAGAKAVASAFTEYPVTLLRVD